MESLVRPISERYIALITFFVCPIKVVLYGERTRPRWALVVFYATVFHFGPMLSPWSTWVEFICSIYRLNRMTCVRPGFPVHGPYRAAADLT